MKKKNCQVHFYFKFKDKKLFETELDNSVEFKPCLIFIIFKFIQTKPAKLYTYIYVRKNIKFKDILGFL